MNKETKEEIEELGVWLVWGLLILTTVICGLVGAPVIGSFCLLGLLIFIFSN